MKLFKIVIFTSVYPSTPSTPTATNLQSISVKVNWSSPNLGDSTLTSYKMQYKKTSDSSWVDKDAGSSTGSTTLTGLKPFTDYKIRMKLNTDLQSNLYSPILSVKTTSDSKYPKAFIV